jgi:hypothetical protein
VSETGPTPDTHTCADCAAPILWLWSPRVHRGLGGWVMFTQETDDGMTIRSHRCREPQGDLSYLGGERAP